MQAGKHVFCQKPLTLTIEENQLIRNACKKFKDRVFQVGTQQRSERDLFLRAINMIHKGLLGNIRRVICGINGSATGGPFPKETPPPSLDWDMWLGQAPEVEYIRQRCHHSFRWWYEYSGGKFTDWGSHHVDIALWALDMNQEGTGPIEFDGTDAKHPIELKDGYPTKDNHFNTSNKFSVECRFANGTEMVISSTTQNGVRFEGSKGNLFVNCGRITGKPVEGGWDKGKYSDDDLFQFYKGKPFEGHKDNFYRCIREGGLPVSDVFTHVQTMNVCHLAAIAARLNRKITWNPKAEKIIDDDQAQAMLARKPRAGFEIPVV